MSTIKYLNNEGTQQLINDIKKRIAKYSTMPDLTDSTTKAKFSEGEIAQYVGTTQVVAPYYTQGDFYKADLTNEAWVKLTYNKEEIDSIVSTLGHFAVVAELPTTDISTSTIYLVPKTSSITGYSDGTTNADIYVETGTATTPTYDKYEYDTTLGIYVFDSEITGNDAETIKGYIDGGTYTSSTVTAESRETRNIKTEYINLDGTTAGWEKIGDTELDTSDFVKYTDLVPITSQELAAMWAD